MTTKRDPQPLLPLTPSMFYVLVALADGQTHGYAILKDVEQLTDGSVRLSTGTLYGIIKRLLADGLIRESGMSAKDKEDERRRLYELTAFGRDVARAEAARLENTLAIARRKALFRRAQSRVGGAWERQSAKRRPQSAKRQPQSVKHQ